MARGKGRAVWFVALVLSLTLALAHGASAVTCSGYAKKACRKNDACQWTGSSCVAPTDVCSGIQAKKVGGVSKKRRCNGKAECRCSGNKKCGTCVVNVGVGAPSPSPDGGPACSSPWTVNPGLTCGMVKNTCADWKYLSCAQSGKTCTGADRTGGGQLVAGEQCSYVWTSDTVTAGPDCRSPFNTGPLGLTCFQVAPPLFCGGWVHLDCTKSGATCTGPERTGGNQPVAFEECTYAWPLKVENPCSSPFYVNSGLTCGSVANTCGGWNSLSCTKSGATCTGPDRTGGNALIAGEYCSYVWPLKVDACSSPWKVNPGLTCGMEKNTCAKWKSLSCSQSGATCTGPDRTGGGQLIAGEDCSYVW